MTVCAHYDSLLCIRRYPHPSLLPSCTLRVRLEPLGMYEPVDISLEELTDQQTHPALRLPLEYRQTQRPTFPKNARTAMVTLCVANLPIGYNARASDDGRHLLDAHAFRALRHAVAVSADKPTRVFAVIDNGCMYFFDSTIKDQVTAQDDKAPVPLLVLDLALDSDICFCEEPKDVNDVPASTTESQRVGEASSAEQPARPLRPRAAVVDGTPSDILAQEGGGGVSSARRPRAGESMSQRDGEAAGPMMTVAGKVDDLDDNKDVESPDAGFPLIFVHSPRQVVICVEFPLEQQEDDSASSALGLLSTSELRFIDWKQQVAQLCSGTRSPAAPAPSCRTRFTSSFAELRVVGDKLTRVLQIREFLFRDVEGDDGLQSAFQMQLLMHIPRIEFASVELSNYAMAWSGAAPAQVQSSLEGEREAPSSCFSSEYILHIQSGHMHRLA